MVKKAVGYYKQKLEYSILSAVTVPFTLQ